MAKCCGPKAFTKKIKVGNDEIPIKGLEPIMFLVFNMNLNEERKILETLRSRIIEQGNLIPEDKEIEFNKCLLREYKNFTNERETKRENNNIYKGIK